MKERQQLDLWDKRANEILRLENSALLEYKSFLKKYSHLLGGSRIKQIVRRIMRDEAKHIDIAKRIKRIVLEERKRQVMKR